MIAKVVVPGAELSHATSGSRVQRHHHLTPYIALVLRGRYLEAGDCGRIEVEAGDVLFHDAFDGHTDQFGIAGADILNLPLARSPAFPKGRVDDADAIVRLAQRDPTAAAAALDDQVEELPVAPLDWPDSLAAALRSESEFALDAWSDAHGLAPTSVSRGFRLAYGVSPKRYRLEQRTAAAARAIAYGSSLVDATYAYRFSDQPHLSRAIRAIYGLTPGRLRH